ncbi:MAG: replicative DNA helicase, partial [Burkholderiaceae bacterium]|nr:replicative DNA helicase [Burkholderiaceae bacterium]
LGGRAYLNALAQNTPSPANIRQYAKIVRDRSVLRKLITESDEIAGMALNPQGREIRDILDAAEQRIFSIAEDGARGRQGFLEIKPILSQVLARIGELDRRENKNDVTGTSTGFIDLDRKTSGLQAGDLVIVAGRPSMGKTAFAMNIAEHVAIENGLPVAVFSMEMPGTQLATRMIGSVGRVDQHRLRTGQLLGDDWERLTYAVGRLNDALLFIDESPGLNSVTLRSSARRLARVCGRLGLVVVDYLQLMSANSPGENRATEIGEISRGLKALAKELSCPVMALSQLNRAVEQRPDRRPRMSDLRESGSIEQDADLILFIHREEVYVPDTPNKGIAEIIIAKQRNGPIGDIRLTFNGEYTKFDNYASAASVY